jgi:hypothetical protein
MLNRKETSSMRLRSVLTSLAIGARVPLRMTAMVAASCLLVGLGAGVALSKTSASPCPAGAAVAAAAAADPAASTAERTLSNAQRKIYEGARAAVDEGVSRGTWNDEDSAQLRAALVTLPPETATEVLRPLILAINEGHVRWQGHEPIF